MDAERIPNGSRMDPEQIPNGSRTDLEIGFDLGVGLRVPDQGPFHKVLPKHYIFAVYNIINKLHRTSSKNATSMCESTAMLIMLVRQLCFSLIFWAIRESLSIQHKFKLLVNHALEIFCF